MKLLLLNGGIRGEHGNTQRALNIAADLAQAAGHQVEQRCLATLKTDVSTFYRDLREADAWLLGSGVYWGSWGSPLQRFLEVLTPLEATEGIVGKPVGALMTCDSTDGMSIAARLLGVLTSFGCMAPPYPSIVLSRLGEQATRTSHEADVWQPADLAILIANLATAAQLRLQWKSWEVQPVGASTGNYPSPGALEYLVEDFLTRQP